MSEPKIEPMLNAYGELVGATATRELSIHEAFKRMLDAAVDEFYARDFYFNYYGVEPSERWLDEFRSKRKA